MKKGCIILFIISLIFAFGVSASAQDNEYSKNEAYGLCVVSKIVEYEPGFNMEKAVDSKTYSDIMSFWFGTKYAADVNPTNSDAVYDLAKYAPGNVMTPYTITSFKDFGFIKKEHRSAYKTMCSAGFLNYDNEYLKPNYPLTYGVFFDMLIHFEDELIFRNGFDVSEGVIADSYSEGNNIVIKQNTDKKQQEFKFNRMHTFYVQLEDEVSSYSYNIKRGSYAKIYSLDGSIIYVSLKDLASKFDKNYNITTAKIYLCNPYENQVIFINSKTGDYMAYTYDDLLVYENKKEFTADDINNYFVDKNCYLILEKDTNTLKYINIIG